MPYGAASANRASKRVLSQAMRAPCTGQGRGRGSPCEAQRGHTALLHTMLGGGEGEGRGEDGLLRTCGETQGRRTHYTHGGRAAARRTAAAEGASRATVCHAVTTQWRADSALAVSLRAPARGERFGGLVRLCVALSFVRLIYTPCELCISCVYRGYTGAVRVQVV